MAEPNVIVTPATRRAALPEESTVISHGGIARPPTPPVEVTTVDNEVPDTPIVFEQGGSGKPIRVDFLGIPYDFPAGTTDEEMFKFLEQVPAEEQEPVEDAPEPFREAASIRRDEGVRRDKEGQHVSYMDSVRDKKHPKGILTGGIGHQMTKDEQARYPKGTVIPDKVVDGWFDTDMNEADDDLTSILESKKVRVPDEVFDVLQNMTFNLGKGKSATPTKKGKGILGFTNMWAAIEVGDWAEASVQMKDSKWFKQVKSRGVRLVNRMASIESKVQEPVAE